MPPAVVIGDNAIHDGPHCHAPIHPPAPTPTPVPHPPIPNAFIQTPATTVLIGSTPALAATAQTKPCTIPGCVPGGPGILTKGSTTVLFSNMPAGRVGDLVMFAACVGPIPMPTGKVMPPGKPTVMIGG